MTRKQLRLRAVGPLRLPAAHDALSMDDFLTQATDEVAARTRCYTVHETKDLTGSVATPHARLCSPEIMKLKSARIKNAAGHWVPLSILTPAAIEEVWGFSTWRTDGSASTEPGYLVAERPNFYLYPAANYSVEDGLEMVGYGVPGESWPLDADEFPLPDYAASAVIYKAQRLYVGYNPVKGGPDPDWLESMHEEQIATIDMMHGEEANGQ